LFVLDRNFSETLESRSKAQKTQARAWFPMKP